MILSHCAGERIHPFPPLAAFWLALALALLVPMTSHAMAQNRTILLDGSRGQYDLRQYVEVLEDRNYTIEQVSSPEFTDRFKRPGPGFFPGQSPNGYWMRFSIKTAPEQMAAPWWLRLVPPQMTRFTLYRPTSTRDTRGWERWDAGYWNPKRSSWKNDDYLATRLHPQRDKTDFYIHYFNEDQFYNPIELQNESAFRSSELRRIIFYAFFVGFSLALILYNLFLFVSLRDISYLWYSLHCTAINIYYLIANDVLIEFIDVPINLLIIYNFLSLALFLFFSSLFIKSFLTPRRHQKKILFTFKTLTTIAFVSIFFTLLNSVAILTPLFSILIISFATTYIVLGIIFWRNGFSSARFFVCAWLVFWLSIVIGGLGGLGLFQDFQILQYTFQIANLIEMLLLSLALADRISKLRQDREAAEALSQAKTAFLASMSHEIRTPINTIMGMNELVRQTELSADQSRNLAVVREASDHLLGIIDDILDFSRIEAGKLELEHMDFILRRTVHTVLDVVRSQAERKGLRLTSHIDPDVPDVVRGDPVRLRQVLMNLLGNSVKFTHSGSVSLTVSRGKTENTLAFTVADTGIGIPRDKQRTIFDSFTQADVSMARRFGGTGLGLSISRQLVELMGGNIDLRSTPGMGSTFSFTAVLEPGDPAWVQAEPESAPARSDPANSGPDESGPMAAPLRLLVAEDNQNNILLMKAVLDKTPHTVRYAGNGREVLLALRAEAFDLILMDLEMPEMSGLDATRAIRGGQAGDNNAAIPVIALTAHALDEVKRQCFEAGVNGFITKPFRMDELLSALASSGAAEPERAAPPAPAAKPDQAAVFDQAGFQAMFGEDKELGTRVKTAFLAELPELIEAIDRALKDRDDKALRTASHYFKTSVSVVCAKRLATMVAELDKAAVERDLGHAEKLWDAMQPAITDIRLVFEASG